MLKNIHYQLIKRTAMQKFKMKLNSGLSFIYRTEGSESQVFEIRMKDDIDMNALYVAASISFQRFPYLNCKLKIREDGAYIESNPVVPMPVMTRHLRPIGGSSTISNLVDLTFWKRSLFVSFHHGLCDGHGIMPFIKTLIYYYLEGITGIAPDIPDVRLAGEQMLIGETADPISEGNYTYDKGKVYKVDRTAYAIPEVVDGEPSGGNSWRYEMSIDATEFMAVCKANNCTPAILISILMQKAVLKLHPDADKPIVSNVICDWRKTIGLPNTFRNCVSSIYLPYSKADEGKPLPEVGTADRDLLAKQRETDTARALASVMVTMADMVDSRKTLEEKQQLVAGFNAHTVDSFICSYIGKADMGEAEKYMDSIHIYTSGTRCMTMEIMSMAGKFTIDLTHNFADDKYARAFVAECAALGLECRCSEAIPYQVPKDHTRNTNFLKSLEMFWNEKVRPYFH